MFTVLFALGRLPGWIAHWLEMHQIPNTKICRPRQVYVGQKKRDFVPMNKRGLELRMQDTGCREQGKASIGALSPAS